MNRSSLIATGMVCASALVISTMVAVGGPLNPPAGALNSSERLLESMTGATEINSVNTPGTADSVFCIDMPGSYILTQDIIVPAGKHGIKVTTDKFIIDHRGFEIRGMPGSLDGVHIEPTAGPTEFEGSAVGANIRDMGGSGFSIIPPNGGLRYLYRIAYSRIFGVAGDGIFKAATGGVPQKDAFTVSDVEIIEAGDDGIDARTGGADSMAYTYDSIGVAGVAGRGIVTTSMGSSDKLALIMNNLDICNTGGVGVKSSLIGSNVKWSSTGGSDSASRGRGPPYVVSRTYDENGFVIDEIVAFDITDTGGSAFETIIQSDGNISCYTAGVSVRDLIAGCAAAYELVLLGADVRASICLYGFDSRDTLQGVEVTNTSGQPLKHFALDMTNCKIDNPGVNGIRLDNGIKNSQELSVQLETVTVSGATGTGIDFFTSNTKQALSLKDVHVLACGGVGANLGNNAMVIDCSFNGNSTGMFIGNDCIVKDSICNRNSANGINGLIGNQIIGCTASFNDLNGIVQMNKCLIDGVVANNNGIQTGDGIKVGNHSTVRNCVVTNSAGTGINAAAFTTVNGNAVSTSGTANIQAGDNSTVTNNNVQGGNKGIQLIGGGVMSQYNTVGPHSICGIESVGDGNMIANNTVNGSTTGTGISVLGMKTIVRDNHVTNNATGIAVGGQNNLVIRNSAGWNTVGNYVITPTGVLSTENVFGEIFNQLLEIRTILNETDSPWSNLEM